MESKKLKLTFCAGAGTVTGANFLLEGEGKKFLIDCGLTQGTKLADDINWKDFQYDPSSIDILFITHSHIDHIGRIPKLIFDGFKGKIYSTHATKDLALPMLLDTVGILSKDVENKLDEMYTEENVKKAMSLWEGVDYHQNVRIEPAFSFSFLDSGHILGSGILELLYNNKKVVFTGDLGNSPSPLLRDTEKVTDADYLIMESVYGDRNHESRDERKKMLESIIEDNYKRGGVLVLPTFSLERSQEMLYEINSFVENKRIPQMPVYLDSPLAIKLTSIYAKHNNCFNDEAKALIAHGDDIFKFPGLKITLSTEESKEIFKSPNPKVIIAGSGMSNGGRIVHHERHYLPDPNSTLLLTGYQAVGTMGRLIEEGASNVRILGEDVLVKAHITKISGYSGHKDSDHLISFVEDTANKVKKVFVVMGEPKSALYLVQKLRDYLGLEAYAPEVDSSVELDCS